MLEPSQLLLAYRMMLRLRYFEEKSIELYHQGEVKGTLHPYRGQEAVAVGCSLALAEGDVITTTFRGGRAHALARGSDPARIFGEFMGRDGGLNKGKGGSMSIIDVAHGIIDANAIVGAGVPLAVGAALTFKYKGRDRVAVAFFGDGATNQGVALEAFNLAAVWQVPVVFVCENNLYSEMTPTKDMVRADLAVRARGFGLPAVEVDGNDVEMVHAAMAAAVATARQGGGPTFVEARTYRHLGHFLGDPEVYRTKEEKEAWQQRDPLLTLPARLVAAGVASPADLAAIQEAVRAEMAAAAAAAVAMPLTDVGEALTNVYA